MKEYKNKLIIALICVLFVSVGVTLFVSFSNQESPMLIKSITPVYDKESTVKVNDDVVVFNDKDQEVKYKVVIENKEDYDVKVSDIKLSTPTEDFLEYTVENFKIDDVVSANSTKELIVSFKTVKKDGWGRNFEDELTADISFAKYTKEDLTTDSSKDSVDKVESKEDIKEEQTPIVDETSKDEVTIPDSDLVNKVEDESKEEVTEKEEDNTGNLVCTKCETKENDCDDWKKSTILVGIFAVVISIIALILLIILIVVFKKYKLLAGIIIFISFISLIPSIKAADLITLPLKFSVAFKSQNVMKPAYVLNSSNTKDYVDYWDYATKIKNIYIQNEIKPIESYSYAFDVTVDKNSRVKSYLVLKSDNSGYYDLFIQADGIIYLNEDSSYYFYNMTYLDGIDNIQGLDTSFVKNMSYMFYKAGYNSTIFKLDLSKFDTSKVTNMSYMFGYAGYNTKTFTLDLSNFDTGEVTNMSYMFCNTGYNSTNLTLNLNSFDTSKVTNMNYMFGSAGYKTQNFTFDLSHFDTSEVTNMSYMFYYTGYSNENFTLDVSNFDTSKVTNMSYMFYYTGYNSTKLNTKITISNPNLTSYNSMYYGAAIKDGTGLLVKYTNETESLVDKMLTYKTNNSHVIKAVDINNLSIGDEILLKGEVFNVIKLSDNDVTMLAKNNIGENYKQTSSIYKVNFSSKNGWEYTPGPKDIDVFTWGGQAKNLLEGYVGYLKTSTGDNNIKGNLITLKELGNLNCTVPSNYAKVADASGRTCTSSTYNSWLINSSIKWWIRSAYEGSGNNVWFMYESGEINAFNYASLASVRPIIIISKETLKNYY